MDAVHFVALILATWRITNLIVDHSEDGPWFVLHRLRHILGVRYDEKDRAYGINELGSAATCIWCASVWVGLIVFLLGYYVTPYIFYPFALSAGALITNKVVKR